MQLFNTSMENLGSIQPVKDFFRIIRFVWLEMGMFVNI